MVSPFGNSNSELYRQYDRLVEDTVRVALRASVVIDAMMHSERIRLFLRFSLISRLS
jgi:hypothetical protein